MNKQSWIFLAKEEKAQYLNECARKVGLTSTVIEKDWWVTTVLYAIHQLPYAHLLLFKGGTSLSKAFKLISRFSEDIDIAISCEHFGKTYSNCKNATIKKLRSDCKDFIQGEFRRDLDKQLNDMGLSSFYTLKNAEIEHKDNNDPTRLVLSYDSISAPQNYTTTQIIIEVGVRSKFLPNEQKTIRNLLIESFENYKDDFGCITVQVSPKEKTFIEKVYLLHEIFSKEYTAAIKNNQKSRHLYDIYQIYKSGQIDDLFTSTQLWFDIARHRKLWNKVSKVCYDSITQNIHIIPPKDFLPIWESDYKNLKENFIYNNTSAPTFEQILEIMEVIQDKVRRL